VPTPLEFKNNLRVLTVAQYLKGADAGSYEKDDGSFIAEFIDKCSNQAAGEVTVAASVTNVCKPLFDDHNLQSCVLDETELNSLFNLAGYVVSRVQKHYVTCNMCISLVIANDVDSSVTRLVS
jgi:hypothetical protein